MRARPIARAAQAAALLGAAAFATCGVRGPPRPPPGTEDQYGKRDRGPGSNCDDLEATSVPITGRTAAEVCEACEALRDRREGCGVTEPLQGRCKALCWHEEWKRNLDPGQDLAARKAQAREFVSSKDGGAGEPLPEDLGLRRPDGGAAPGADGGAR